MDGPVGFLRFGEGTLATYGPGSSRIVKFQWTMEFEGSEAGILKFLRKTKVLGSAAGRAKRVSPGRRNRPAGLKYSGKRKVWTPQGPSPDPGDRPVLLDPPALVLGA